MSGDRPSGAELLDQARQELLEELLPALPRSLVLQARMIASAMAIAARELRRPSDPYQDIEKQLQALKTKIRAGELDGSVGTHAWLLGWARGRVGLSNPKADG